jgi:hypothetical protein
VNISLEEVDPEDLPGGKPPTLGAIDPRL